MQGAELGMFDGWGSGAPFSNAGSSAEDDVAAVADKNTQRNWGGHLMAWSQPLAQPDTFFFIIFFSNCTPWKASSMLPAHPGKAWSVFIGPVLYDGS